MIINLLRIYLGRQEKEIPQTTVTENAHLKFMDLSVLNAEGNLHTKTGICSLCTIKMAITGIIPLMVLTGKICVLTAMKMSTAEDCLLITSVVKNRFFSNLTETIFEPIRCIILLQPPWDLPMMVVLGSRSCAEKQMLETYEVVG
jgi:hypothetical protein